MRTITVELPKCRVPGCPDVQFQKKLGYCGRHYNRFRRTGKVGPAKSYHASGSRDERPARKKVAIAALRRFKRQHGGRAFLRVGGRLVYLIGPKTGRGSRWSSTVVVSLARRGWLRVSSFRADGSKVVEVTPAGKSVLGSRGKDQR